MVVRVKRVSLRIIISAKVAVIAYVIKDEGVFPPTFVFAMEEVINGVVKDEYVFNELALG